MSAYTGPFFITPVGKQIPFDATGSALTSTDVNAAIIEAGNLAANASRGATICGFDGTASSGRWLEFFSNNPSNNSPFILAEASRLRAISLSSSTNSTGTVTVYRNGVSITTISLTASRKNANNTLNISLAALDEVSVQVTAGSITRCTFFLYIQTLP